MIHRDSGFINRSTTQVNANMLEAPIRSIVYGSELSLKTETLQQISQPGRISIQNGDRKPDFEIDRAIPFCTIQSYNSFNNILTEFVDFKVMTVDGAAVATFNDELYFKTTFSLQTKNLNSIRLECLRPLTHSAAIEELNLTELSQTLGSHIKIKSLSIIPGSFEPRYTFPMSKDLVLNHLKIKLNKSITLIPDISDPQQLVAKVGKCKLFQLNNSEKKTASYPKNSIFTPKSMEVAYYRDPVVDLGPHIILRFDDTLVFGIFCQGSSKNRMFDYQDFWDATGKNGPISWIVTQE